MLYTYTVSDSFLEKQTFVLAVKTNPTDASSMRTMLDILASERLISVMSDMGIRTKVIVPKSTNPQLDSEVPYIIPSSDSSSLDCSVVFSLFAKQKDIPESFYSKMKAYLKQNNNISISEEELSFLRSAYIKFDEYRTGKIVIPIKVPSLSYADNNLTAQGIKRYNGRQGPQFEYLTEEVNVTNTMKDPEDIFFIQIPSLEKIKSDDFPMAVLLPDPKDIFEPYPHPIYGTTLALRYMEGTFPEQQEILKLYQERTKDPNIAVPKIPREFVVGSPEMSDLPIQLNEEGYYNALTEFIKYDIAQLGRPEPVDELFAKGQCSRAMLEYLQELVKKLAAYNYMHTRNFPVIVEDPYENYEERMSGDSDEDTSSLLGEITDGEYYDQEDSENVFSGPAFLTTYLITSADKIGLRVYVEAIIRLSRWGNRKPSALHITGMDDYLDMNTLTSRNSLGSKEDLEPVNVDGYLLELEGVISVEDKVKDQQLLKQLGVPSPWITIPVGLNCIRHYAGGIKQSYFLTIPEAVMMYTSSNVKLIKGIDFDGNKFRVEKQDATDSPMWLNIARTRVNDSTNQMNTAHISRALKSLCVEYGVNPFSGIDVLGEYLQAEDALTKKLPALSFGSKEELLQRRAETPLPVNVFIRINVASLLVGEVLKASKLATERDVTELGDILNIYKEVQEAAGIISERSFLYGESAEVETAAVEVPPSSMGTSNSFSASPTKESTTPISAPVMELENDEDITNNGGIPLHEQIQNSIIQPFPEGAELGAIKDSKGRVIAGFYTEGTGADTIRIICGKTDLEAYPADKVLESASKFTVIEYFIYDTIFRLASGPSEKFPCKFNSLKSLQDMRDYMRLAFKEGMSL